jgi:hypothetical protein
MKDNYKEKKCLSDIYFSFIEKIDLIFNTKIYIKKKENEYNLIFQKYNDTLEEVNSNIKNRIDNSESIRLDESQSLIIEIIKEDEMILLEDIIKKSSVSLYNINKDIIKKKRSVIDLYDIIFNILGDDHLDKKFKSFLYAYIENTHLKFDTYKF